MHEDEVPDLHDRVAWSIHVRGAVLRIVRARSHVVVNLAAWTTRAGLTHLPEIVLAPEAQDSLSRRAYFFPQALGVFIRRHFGVALVDREPQPRRIEFQNIDEQLPGKLDRVFLEIIAKRKIAEHLEKCVVPRGLSNLVEVVVLATRPHALLRRRGAHVIAFLDAQKRVFKLIHSGVGKQQRRVVRRQERRRTHGRVPLFFEIFRKASRISLPVMLVRV